MTNSREIHPLVPFVRYGVETLQLCKYFTSGENVHERKRMIIFRSPGMSNERKLQLRIKSTQLSEWKNPKLASGMSFLIGTSGIKVAFFTSNDTAVGEFI